MLLTAVKCLNAILLLNTNGLHFSEQPKNYIFACMYVFIRF